MSDVTVSHGIRILTPPPLRRKLDKAEKVIVANQAFIISGEDGDDGAPITWQEACQRLQLKYFSH